jgi:hypothetical protein
VHLGGGVSPSRYPWRGVCCEGSRAFLTLYPTHISTIPTIGRSFVCNPIHSSHPWHACLPAASEVHIVKFVPGVIAPLGLPLLPAPHRTPCTQSFWSRTSLSASCPLEACALRTMCWSLSRAVRASQWSPGPSRKWRRSWQEGSGRGTARGYRSTEVF